LYDIDHRHRHLSNVQIRLFAMPSRVLIVDDHAVVRIGVRTLLSTNPKWEVCGEAADGNQALREIVELAPDVVILDLSLPGMNGFEVAKEIRRIAPSTKIVFFTIHEVPATAREVGADGFVLKSSGVEALEKTLETVLQRRSAAGA
jgi:DNA-binding NarL/FixJ family response regulator